MSNIDRAAEIIYQKTGDHYLVAPIAKALEDAGLLATDPQIIRDPDVLDAFDSDAVLMDYRGGIRLARNTWRIPCAIIATGDQVRAARQALKEATE